MFAAFFEIIWLKHHKFNPREKKGRRQQGLNTVYELTAPPGGQSSEQPSDIYCDCVLEVDTGEFVKENNVQMECLYILTHAL